MRNFQTFAFFLKVIPEVFHLTFEMRQTIHTVVFFRRFQQRLHTHTDTQERFAGIDRVRYFFIHSSLEHFRHAITHSAYTRQDNAVGTGSQCRVRGNTNFYTRFNKLKRF